MNGKRLIKTVSSATVEAFISCACQENPKELIPSSWLYQRFLTWYRNKCHNQQGETWSLIKFGKELGKLGFRPARKNTGNFYHFQVTPETQWKEFECPVLAADLASDDDSVGLVSDDVHAFQSVVETAAHSQLDTDSDVGVTQWLAWCLGGNGVVLDRGEGKEKKLTMSYILKMNPTLAYEDNMFWRRDETGIWTALDTGAVFQYAALADGLYATNTKRRVKMSSARCRAVVGLLAKFLTRHVKPDGFENRQFPGQLQKDISPQKLKESKALVEIGDYEQNLWTRRSGQDGQNGYPQLPLVDPQSSREAFLLDIFGQDVPPSAVQMFSGVDCVPCCPSQYVHECLADAKHVLSKYPFSTQGDWSDLVYAVSHCRAGVARYVGFTRIHPPDVWAELRAWIWFYSFWSKQPCTTSDDGRKYARSRSGVGSES